MMQRNENFRNLTSYSKPVQEDQMPSWQESSITDQLKPYEEISTDNTQDTNFKKLTPNIKSKAILKLNI